MPAGRQRREPAHWGLLVTDIKLMHLATAPHLASFECLEQLRAETKHGGGNGAAFFLIGVEQRLGPTDGDRS